MELEVSRTLQEPDAERRLLRGDGRNADNQGADQELDPEKEKDEILRRKIGCRIFFFFSNAKNVFWLCRI